MGYVSFREGNQPGWLNGKKPNSSPGTGMGAYMSPAPMGPSAVPFEMGHMQMYPPFMQGTLDFANYTHSANG